VRHASWYTEETYAVLRQNETALCLSETDKQTPPEVLTTGFTYARLRLEDYTPSKSWPGRNASTPGLAKAWMYTLISSTKTLAKHPRMPASY